MMRYKKLDKFQRDFLYEVLEVFKCNNITQLGKLLGLTDPTPYKATIQKFKGNEKDRYILALTKLYKGQTRNIKKLEQKLQELRKLRSDLYPIYNTLDTLTEKCSKKG